VALENITTIRAGVDPLNSSNVPAGASKIHVLTLRLKRLLDSDINEILRKNSELSLPEWRILSVLSRSEQPLSQKDVVSEMVIAQGQASRALFSLQSSGLVQASQSKRDRRSWNYCLTAQGRSVFGALLPQMEVRRAALEGAVSADELLQFERIALKIARVAQARLEQT